MKKNAIAILILFAVFGLLIALNFIFFVDTRSGGETEWNADRSSYRSTPYGTLAYYTLLKERGYDVGRFEKSFTQLKDREPGTLIVISPPESHLFSEEELKSLQKWIEAGGYLIVFDREIHITLGDVLVQTERETSKSAVRPVEPTPVTRGVEHLSLSQFASRVRVHGRSTVVHFADNESAVVADATLGSGRMIFITDPFIVANNGIDKADNAQLALNLVADRPRGRISFDEYHHGYSSAGTEQGLMSYFRGTPVPWMLAQIATIGALIIYSYGRRFGRAIPLRRERRTTNLEFVSSLANISRLARATDLAMQNIYWEFRKRLCRFAGVPAHTPTQKLAAAAARRSNIRPAEIGTLLTRCEAVARGEETSDHELLKLVVRIREIESTAGL
jgi:uncharacterized protein DUF4350